MPSIGDKLFKRRKELNLTLEEVGRIVGVSKSTVRKWETGYIENMKRDKIELLAKALQTSPAFIMGWKEEPDNSLFKVKPNSPVIKISEKHKLLLNKYEKLDLHGKKAVDNLIDNELERIEAQQVINIPAIARRQNYSKPFELNLTKEQIERIKNAPSVASDDDL